MNSVIEINDLGKGYKNYHGRFARIKDWVYESGQNYQFNWIFRGVNFSIKQGESVAIIGQNGAGKSTLLKIITGTTRATCGSYKVNGRISALLELGMGFHGDFTGRQNVYLSGQLMGFDRNRMDSVIQDIYDFSEIGDYFDAPVRTYSSGMQVRLAFSIATAFRPEILIVDEALAVGDTYFQHKCYSRIRDFKDKGTSLLFVSHDPGAVRTLCDRAILLGDGTQLMDGLPSDVLDYYNARIAEKEKQTVTLEKNSDGSFHTRSGTGEAKIRHIFLSRADHTQSDTFEMGSRMDINLTVDVKQPLSDMTIGFAIRDRLGNEVFGTNTWNIGKKNQAYDPGALSVVIGIDKLNIGPGNYSITLALHSSHSHIEANYDWWDHAAIFHVVNTHSPDFVGICALDTSYSIGKI